MISSDPSDGCRHDPGRFPVLPTSVAAWQGSPVAGRVTDTLTSPAERFPVVSERTRAELCALIERTLRDCRGRPPGPGSTTVTPFLVRQLHARRPLGPFKWSPRTARRTIGVAAARRCVSGRWTTPGTEVAATVTDLVGSAGRPGSLGSWLAGLDRPVLAATVAEATTWATNLLDALDWSRPDLHPLVGTADRWWRSGGTARLAVRGRTDVSVAVPGPLPGAVPVTTTDATPIGSDGHLPRATLTMFDGSPRPSGWIELGLDALVSALCGPVEEVPVRVSGWWPAAGRLAVLRVDAGLLFRTAEAVAATLSETVDQDRDQGPWGATRGPGSRVGRPTAARRTAPGEREAVLRR